MSFFILGVIFYYGTYKFGGLISRANPNVTNFVEEGALDSSNARIDFRSIGMNIAFSVEGFLD